MESMISLAVANLTSPMILFFLLGLLAALARSDLNVPEAIAKGMSLYLMMAIGFKGGVGVSEYGVDLTMILALLAGNRAERRNTADRVSIAHSLDRALARRCGGCGGPLRVDLHCDVSGGISSLAGDCYGGGELHGGRRRCHGDACYFRCTLAGPRARGIARRNDAARSRAEWVNRDSHRSIHHRCDHWR